MIFEKFGEKHKGRPLGKFFQEWGNYSGFPLPLVTPLVDQGNLFTKIYFY
jgi:aminopeptidase N